MLLSRGHYMTASSAISVDRFFWALGGTHLLQEVNYFRHAGPNCRTSSLSHISDDMEKTKRLKRSR